MNHDHPTPAASNLTARTAALLAALGDTETQVAATLKAAGITGRRGECGACPIAVYLLKSDLGCYAVDVDGLVSLWFVGPDDVQHVEKIAMPDAVVNFVVRFDTGLYDELVAGGTR